MPPTRRRAETLRRLHEAALAVFAAEGFGRASVEQVCERAGFTRGAFYSNFGSLDELFLAMWAERSRALLADLRAALAAADTTDVRTARDLVELVDAAVGVDDAWYRVTAEFTAHALRTPGLREVVAQREDAIAGTLTPVLVSFLRRVGRTVADPRALALALVAVHDGTTVQCLVEPDDPAARRRRLDLFEAVVLAYTTPGGDA